MEPRVPNLILRDNQDLTRNGHLEASISPYYPPSTATHLPAIRTLAETPYTSGSPFQDKPNQSWHQNTIIDPYLSSDALKREEQGLGKEQERQAQVVLRPAKSAVPLEQVLNDSSPQPRKDYQFLNFNNEEPRKRRRVEPSDPRLLPKPSPSQKQPNRRRHGRPLLPPLLAPLHNPPAEARIVPSIDTNDYRSRQAEIPQPEPKSAPAITTTSIPPKPTIDEIDPALLPDTGQEIQKIPQPITKQPEPKRRKKNKRWTEEETKDLFRGIAKFGVGSWKKILNHEEYHFNGRSAVDLKDRFRTVCPEEYNGSKSRQNGGRKSSAGSDQISEAVQPEPEQPAKTSSGGTSADRLAQLGIQGPFPKRQRRGRREFTEDEDKALLKGFDKYGAKWKLIRDDPELELGSRSRTDLRDRFRNRYPKRFIEAGYKFRLKESDESKDDKAREGLDPAKDGRDVLEPHIINAPVTAEDNDASLLFGVAPSTSTFDPPLSATTRDRTAFPLRVLTEPIPFHFADVDLSDYEHSPVDGDEDPTTITLSRNIFDWADAQNPRHPLKASTDQQNQALSSQPKTLSALDQFRINPFVAMKGPSTSSLAHLINSEDTEIGNGPANISGNVGKEHGFRAPHLPLAGILNGPASLPSASELMREVDAEGK